MKYIILAGGFATRLWPLTEKRAKPLLLLAGKTILEHIFKSIPEDGEVLLLTNSAFEDDFRSELSRLRRSDVEIFCEDAESDGQKLGAVKALSLALETYNIKSSVCVIAGDNLLPELDVKALSCAGNEARVVVREVETLNEARKFGVVEVADGSRVTSFVEKPEKPRSQLVSTGFMSFGSELIPVVHEVAEKEPDSLGSIFTSFLCHDAAVEAVTVGGEWFDVGSFDTYLLAHEALQSVPLLKGQNCHDKDNIFSGKVSLGAGCRVENCEILDSVIYPGVVLKNAHITRSVIDKNCVLTGVDINQKLIRAGTVIEGGQ